MDIQHTDDGYVGTLSEVWARVQNGKVAQLTRAKSQTVSPWPDIPVADPNKFYSEGRFEGVPQTGEVAFRVTGAQCGLHYSVTPTGQCHPNAAQPLSGYQGAADAEPEAETPAEPEAETPAEPEAETPAE